MSPLPQPFSPNNNNSHNHHRRTPSSTSQHSLRPSQYHQQQQQPPPHSPALSAHSAHSAHHNQQRPGPPSRTASGTNTPTVAVTGLTGLSEALTGVAANAGGGAPLESRGALVVFSGGTAANSLVDAFDELAGRRQCPLSYVIPISDNGGSTSEIIRVFGGPGIGDVRSRLVRLIPKSHSNIRALLNHRLSSDGAEAVREWQSIVAGSSELWTPIPGPQRELLRSMLNHVNFEMLKRARPPHNTFDLSTASIGNLFLTGARLFTGNFESAIYLLALIGSIPAAVSVVPAINSNFAHHISAELASGESIVGQNAISHPSAPMSSLPGWSDHFGTTDPTTETAEDANLPGSLPSLRQGNITFTKAQEEDLPSPIRRIWYINPYGQEMPVAANPKACDALRRASAVVYSIGSLYTSIVPCLVLRGVGDALAALPASVKKVLILNGSVDRESGPRASPMTAVDFVASIARACEQSRGHYAEPGVYSWKTYVNTVVYIEGEGVPLVDKALLNAAGVETVRCWSRRDPESGALRYDEKGLVGALEAVLGKGTPAALSRRNTIVNH